MALLLTGLLIFQSGCQSISLELSRRRTIRQALFRYQEALNQRSAEKLSSLLGDKVQVEGLTDELSRAGLKAGMYWPPSPISNFRIESITRSAVGTDVQVAFYFSNSMLLMRIGFDESLRIRTLDPVPLGKPPEAKVSKAFSSTFVENQGLLFVRARINDRSGFLLVDTGSSGLLLNKKFFLPDFQNAMPGVTSTVQGIKPQLGASALNSFQWGELRAKGIRGQLHDFSAMETPAISPLLGAVGHEQLKNCAVVFDWRNRRIDVRPAGDEKAPPPPAPKAVIAFTYFLHVPAFPVKIGNTTCRMVFDSGAQINMIPNLHGLGDHFQKVDATTKISDGGQIGQETSLMGLIDEMRIGGALYRDFPCVVFEVPFLDGQGIIGSPLIQKGRMEINFPKRTISVW